MLHGWGANAADVAALANYLHLPQIQCYFPNAPHEFPYSPVGRMWYDLPPDYRFGDLPTRLQLDQLQTSRDRLLDWLNSLEALTGVPLERTILAGFSQGGAMTLDVGLTLPLAAVMVLSGYAHRPIALPPETSPPVLLVHGSLDQVVPLQAAHQVHEQLLAQGGKVQYHELTMGHEIQPIVLKLMQSFIEETVFPPEFR